MLLSCLVLQLGVWFLMAKAAVGIALINLSVGLIATSSALTFLVLPYMIVFDRLQRLVDRRSGSIEAASRSRLRLRSIPCVAAWLGWRYVRWLSFRQAPRCGSRIST